MVCKFLGSSCTSRWAIMVALGGGSGGGGDSRGVSFVSSVDLVSNGVGVLGPVRGISSSLEVGMMILPSIELTGGRTSGVFGIPGPSLTSCWGVCRVSLRVML